MFGLGLGEILVILIIALVFVGPKRLPDLARGLGRGIFEFQKAMQSMKDEINKPESQQIAQDKHQDKPQDTTHSDS